MREGRGEKGVWLRDLMVFIVVARFVSYGIRRSVSVHLANTFGYGG